MTTQGNFLHIATRQGNLETVRHLIDKGTDVNVRDDNGMTPLHVAAERGYVKIVDYLVVKGAEIDIRDENGQTPLHLAAERGRFENTLKYLVDKGAGVNIKDKKGRTPLHIAVREFQVRTMEFLVENKANINSKDNHGVTPLHMAAKKGRCESILGYLVGQGADINIKDKNGHTPLHIAVKEFQMHIVKSLVDNGADINSKDNHGMTPLHVAAEKGDRLDIVKYLCKEADINIKDCSGQTPMHIAAKEGNEFTMKGLVKLGADINIKDKDGRTPLDVAVEKGYMNIAKFFLGDTMSEVNSLHIAARQGNLHTVRCLIHEKTDVNVKDDNGMTPLHMAAERGYIEIVDCLVSSGADIEIRDETGRTPLHMAAEKGRFDNSLKCLVDKGAGVNIKDKNGQTPLHTAVRAFRLHTVEFLVQNKAIINSKDNEGLTPLHIAAGEGRCEDTLKYLVGSGADVNIKDNNGWTPLHIAVKEFQVRTVKFLVENGADMSSKNKEGTPKKDSCMHLPYLLIIYKPVCYPNLPMTSLHVAAKKGECLEIVKLLVAKGADINIKDNNGQTPMHTAAKDGNKFTMKGLAKLGADINIKDNDGSTPLDVAVERGYVDIAEHFKGVGMSQEVHNIPHLDISQSTEVKADSNSDEDSDKESHVSTTTITTGRGRKRAADSRSDKEDSETELHVESTITITTGRKRKRTADSKSDKEDSEEESHVESTTTSTNCRKRKRTAVIPSGNSAVQTERKLNDDHEPGSSDSAEQVELNSRIKSLEAENERLKRQLDQDKPKSNYNSVLGAEVVREEELVVTNEEMNFQWKDHGFKLHVQENSLPEGISEYSVNIKASLASQFELPEGYELVSAVYWVKTPGNFTKPMIVEVQHCANFRDPTQLCFVSTNCAQKSLPYKFKVIDGGTFTLGNKYGALSTTHICGTGVAKKVEPNKHSCQYCAQVYFTVKNLKDYWYYCHFVITKYLEMCLAVAKRKYQKEYDIAPAITIDGDHVALDIPEDGTQTVNGWEILPIHKAHIKKDRVDSFSSEDTLLPECVLLLEWKQKDKPPEPLKYKVKLKGTGEESDFFRIVYNPESQPHPLASTLGSQAAMEGVPLSETHQKKQHDEDGFVERPQAKLRDEMGPFSSAVKKAKQLGVQFIDPIEIIPCDTHGCEYYNPRHDVEVRIPEGAIPPSDGIIKIEFGVAMYGPFKLTDGISMRRVSPVVWLCAQQNGFSGFQKDVEITIPHFVDFSTEDAHKYLRFLKADHQFEASEIEYQLKSAGGRAAFNRAAHGTLLTKHFCSVCITSSVTLPNEKIKYYLGGAISLKAQDWQIIFYACYFLPSCIWTVEQQLDKDSKLIYPICFMFANGKELRIKFQSEVSGWLLAMESPNKISSKEMEFQRISIEELQLLEQKRLYPPRFVVTITGCSTAKNSLVAFTFEGATQEIVKEISLTKAISPPPPPPSIVYQKIGLESVDGTTVLDEDDLRDVRSAVVHLAGRWKDLGISLGIHSSKLDAFDSHSTSDCLREILTLWLRQSYNVKRFGKPTWRRLVEAVEDDVGGNNPALAQTIAKDHPGSHAVTQPHLTS